MRSVLEAFPGAQIVAVRRPQEAAQAPAPEPEATPEADADISYLDETVSDDDL